MAGQVRYKNAQALRSEACGDEGHDAFVRRKTVEEDDVTLGIIAGRLVGWLDDVGD